QTVVGPSFSSGTFARSAPLGRSRPSAPKVPPLSDRLFFLRLLLQPLNLQDRLIGRRILQDVLPVETLHLGVVLGILLLLARLQLLFARVLGDAEIVEVGLTALGDGFRVQHQMVLGARQRDRLVAREDLVAAVLLVPLRQRR